MRVKYGRICTQYRCDTDICDTHSVQIQMQYERDTGHNQYTCSTHPAHNRTQCSANIALKTKGIQPIATWHISEYSLVVL
jgi:hypothetical protein